MQGLCFGIQSAIFALGVCSSKSAEEYLASGKEHLWQFEYKSNPHEGELAIEDFSDAIRLNRRIRNPPDSGPSSI
jgi:hypothetical protein